MAVVFDTPGNRRMVAAMLHSEVRAAAELVLARAQALAAVHRLSGRYSASLKVQASGSLDYDVVATDPAAVPIEFGHTTKHGRQVPGQYILTRAAAG